MKPLIKSIRTLCLIGLFFSGTAALAQMDPNSALLLRSSGKAPTKDDLDSSRYQVRENPRVNSDDRRLQSNQVVPTQQQPTGPITPKAPKAVETSQDLLKTMEQNGHQPQQAEPEGVAEAMQEILIGGTLENITKYRQLLDANDYRQNIVDLSIEPIYIYNDSKSNFWLREYFTSSPGLNIGAKIWITPFFGFHTSYQTSLNASIKTAFTDPGRTPVDHEWFSGGLRFRKFFGVHQQASGLIFAIDFSEYQMKIESSAQNRVGVKSSGVRLGVESLLPSSSTHQWNLGVHIIPRLDHKHVQTGISAQSGNNQESTKFGVSLGSRFIFSRKSQVFWRLSHEIEKNLFDGQSSISDARTGASVTGVEVTNSFTIFSIGYTWGN